MTTIRKATLFAASAVLTAASLQAQQGSGTMIDERWRPFLGCWISSSAGMAGPMVCMVPTSQPSTVEMVAVVRDSIVSRAPITASGAKVQTTRDGCTGWESAQWSADERRLLTTTEFTCSGQPLQKASGIYAMKQGDEFAHIEGIKTRSGTRVRIMNFLMQDDTTRIPREIVRRLPRMGAMPQLASRLEAAAELTSADVAEAAETIDAPVVEAWLADRGQVFALSTKDLIALHDLKTPESVIDMMVAVSNPEVFALATNGKPAARSQEDWRRRKALSRGVAPFPNGAVYGLIDDYGWNPYIPLGLYSGYPYSWYARNCLTSPYAGLTGNFGCGSWYGQYPGGGFGNGYGYGSGYGNGYGYGGGWIPGNTPIVIVPVSNLPPTPPGIVQKGRGYSQGSGGGDNGRTGTPSPNVGSNGGSGSASGGSTSTGSSSAGSSSSGAEQRTAKPRP